MVLIDCIRYDDSFNYREEIQQELHSLCKETNETVSFLLSKKFKSMYLNSIPNKFIKHVTEIGVPKPLKEVRAEKL